LWAYPGTAQIFWVSPIISGRSKVTDFKFGGYIYRANPYKSPLKFRRKVSVAVSRDCPFVRVPPIIQACRGYEISHPYPYPYPQIFAWISMDISISIDAYPVHM